MMNWIWLGLIVTSIICAGFTGQMQAVTIRSFESAKEAVWLALKLIGIMAFWLGIMKVAQESGLLKVIARILRRPMRWLFPDVPEDHPAMSAMILNFGANMLGLANAATPFGIKAMVELNRLNRHKGTATNAMCLFLAINTSSLSLLATGTIGLRAAAGSTDPASIWLPSLMASGFATIVAIVSIKLLQRLKRFELPELVNEVEAIAEKRDPDTHEVKDEDLADESEEVGEERRIPVGLGVKAFIGICVLGFVASAIYHFVGLWGAIGEYNRIGDELSVHLPILFGVCGGMFSIPQLDAGVIIKGFFSFWAIPALMGGLLLYGVGRGVRVYETLVEGAKEGYQVAVRIIPYLVAIIVAVAMFKASGAMDILTKTIGRLTALIGMPAEVLPMAIIRPLSGNGAFGYMSSIFTQYGPDSFVGQMVSVMQGSTETTLYVLAVYFGSVQVYKVRHALAGGLLADLAGIIAAVVLCNMFF